MMRSDTILCESCLRHSFLARYIPSPTLKCGVRMCVMPDGIFLLNPHPFHAPGICITPSVASHTLHLNSGFYSGDSVNPLRPYQSAVRHVQHHNPGFQTGEGVISHHTTFECRRYGSPNPISGYLKNPINLTHNPIRLHQGHNNFLVVLYLFHG